MTVATQSSFLGAPTVSGNLRDRIRYILEEHPDARDDYKLAIFIYWCEFDGLTDILGDRADAFREWFISDAVSPQTLRNRTQEVQNRHYGLDASPEVEALRQKQSKRGPVL